jgi:hypothetical protein
VDKRSESDVSVAISDETPSTEELASAIFVEVCRRGAIMYNLKGM